MKNLIKMRKLELGRSVRLIVIGEKCTPYRYRSIVCLEIDKKLHELENLKELYIVTFMFTVQKNRQMYYIMHMLTNHITCLHFATSKILHLLSTWSSTSRSSMTNITFKPSLGRLETLMFNTFFYRWVRYKTLKLGLITGTGRGC